VPPQFTLPPDTRAAGTGNPPVDMNGVVDTLTAMGAVYNVLDASYSGGADPAGVADSTTAISAALAALPASGGAVIFPPGTYLMGSGVTITQAGIYLAALIPGTVTINYTGSGDCIRMYTPLSYTHGQGGGILGGIIIDGTGAGAGASGAHIGDIYRLKVDFGVRNFIGTGSKGLWFDNQYWWAEMMTGQVWAQNCTSHVVFDNSANPAGNATGSFDRAVLDIYLDMKGKGNGVIWQNGALCTNGRLGIYGNTSYGAALYYTLTFSAPTAYSFTATNASPCVFTAAGWYFGNGNPVILSGGSLPAGFTAGTTYYTTGTSGAAFGLAATPSGAAINSTSTGSGTVQNVSYARIYNSVLFIGVECDGSSGTQPATINFGNPAVLSNGIFNSTGLIDFSGALPFAANPSNWTSNFEFDGPVYGDSHLLGSSPLGRTPYSNGAITNGSTLVTRYNAVNTVAPAGNVTGIILSADLTANWRTVTVVNQSAYTVTFDVAGTSHVADGTADVIQANTAATYVWDFSNSLWYRTS
jgi:hypothetical protein